MSDSLRDALEKVLDRHECITPDTPETNRKILDDLLAAVAAHPAEPAPVASPVRVAEVLKTELLRQQADEWFDVPGLARYLRESLLAAGVFREPPTREQVIEALAKAEGRNPEGKSEAWQRMAEETFGFRADAVLNLLGGTAE